MQEDVTCVLPMVAVLILCAFKQLSGNSKDGWIKNRIKGFSGAIGNKDAVELWDRGRYPQLDAMIRIYAFMPANFNLRKTLFKVIYSIARYSESNMFVRVCQEIV